MTTFTMKTIDKPDALLRRELLALWERAFKTTHVFFEISDFRDIRAETEALLYDAELALLVAFAGEKPAAFAGVRFGELRLLFVDAPLQGRGLGRLLVEHAFTHNELKTVDVYRENRPAWDFFEHMGFYPYAESWYDTKWREHKVLHFRTAGEARVRSRSDKHLRVCSRPQSKSVSKAQSGLNVSGTQLTCNELF